LNGERRPAGRKPGRAFVGGYSISTSRGIGLVLQAASELERLAGLVAGGGALVGFVGGVPGGVAYAEKVKKAEYYASLKELATTEFWSILTRPI
jgi:hypothetical protein